MLRVELPPTERARVLDLPLPAFVVENFLSETECAQLIATSERVGYDAALLNVGLGRQMQANDVRKSGRALIDAPEVAGILSERLQSHLAKLGLEHGPRGGWKRCTGLNERLRFLKYEPGDYFKPHADGRYVRPAGDPRGEGDESLFTLMLYLNAPARGGATNFLPTGSGSKKPKACSVQPHAGLALVFDHKLWHEGAMLVEGVKYAIRTDIMFSRRDAAVETGGGEGVGGSRE